MVSQAAIRLRLRAASLLAIASAKVLEEVQAARPAAPLSRPASDVVLRKARGRTNSARRRMAIGAGQALVLPFEAGRLRHGVATWQVALAEVGLTAPVSFVDDGRGQASLTTLTRHTATFAAIATTLVAMTSLVSALGMGAIHHDERPLVRAVPIAARLVAFLN